MSEPICRRCNDRPPEPGKSICSRCKWAARPRLPCIRCGEPTGYPRSRTDKVDTALCRSCRGVHASKCTCTACRERQRAWFRAYYQRTIKPQNKNRTCDQCGIPIRGKGGAADGRSLCRPHRQKATRATTRQRERRQRRRQRVLRKIEEAARGTKGTTTWEQRRCTICLDLFMIDNIRRTDATCGPTCRAIQLRLKASKWISREDRLAIYRRDNLTCQLCGQPVSLKATGNRRATLDHITPRSLGGSHHPDNLRLAHMICNSLRGTKPDQDRHTWGGYPPTPAKTTLRHSANPSPDALQDGPHRALKAVLRS